MEEKTQGGWKGVPRETALRNQREGTTRPRLAGTLEREAQEVGFPPALNPWRCCNREALQKQGSVKHPLEADDD